jgi:dATP pyrophosphohydrolase
VTGGNEDEETLIETLKRELEEEVGIEEKQIKKIIESIHYFEWLNDSMELIKEYCFGVEVFPQIEIKLSEEHDDFKWCGFEEAFKSLKWDGNKTALFKLNEILKK